MFLVSNGEGFEVFFHIFSQYNIKNLKTDKKNFKNTPKAHTSLKTKIKSLDDAMHIHIKEENHYRSIFRNKENKFMTPLPFSVS